MNQITGLDIGPPLIQALNLGKGVRSIDLRVRIKEPVMVTIERAVFNAEIPAIVGVMEQYALQPKPPRRNPFSILSEFNRWFDWEASHTGPNT